MPEKKQAVVYLTALTAITSAVLEGWNIILMALFHVDNFPDAISVRGYLTDTAAVWVLTFLITYLIGGVLADRMTLKLLQGPTLKGMHEEKRKAVFSAVSYSCCLTITVSIIQIFLYVFLPDGAGTGILIRSLLIYVLRSFPAALSAMYFCIMPLSAAFLRAFVKIYTRKRKRL